MDLAHGVKRIFAAGLGQHQQGIVIGFKTLGQAFDLCQEARVAVISDFGGIQNGTDLHGFAGSKHDATGIWLITDFCCGCLYAGDGVGFDFRPVFKRTRYRRDR